MPASPILLLVPYRNKAAVLYSQIPTSASASGDMVVSRAGVSTRVNAQGLIQSVAANVPRLNYPLGGVANGCPALLVEPAGTNLFARSNELNIGAPWTQDNISFTTGSTSAFTSPDGTTNAFLLADTSGNTRHRISQQPTTSFVSGTTYTASIFVKKNSSNRFLLINANTAFGAMACLNLDTLAITNINGTGASIDNYGNGWYRFSVRGTATSTQATSVFIQMQNAAADGAYIGDGSSFYLFAAQLEVGSVPTSYIPTTTGTVTRNADIVTNNTFVIPNLIGAILTEFDSPTSGTYFLDNIPIPIASGSNKIAISYTPTTLTIYRNGAQVSGSPVTPPGGTAPVIGNVINIGHNNQLYQLGSGIKSFVLYSSTLSAAEASGLTT